MRRKISWTDGRKEGRTDRGKTLYPPPPSGSGGLIEKYLGTDGRKDGQTDRGKTVYPPPLSGI